MKVLNTISTKKALLIFAITCVLNFVISGLVYYNLYFPGELKEYSNIANFIIKEFQDQDIQIKITNNGLDLKNESYMIESKNFPVALNFANLIYIAKQANYADFKEKNTLAILNDKELVLNLNNEYQNLPLASIVNGSGEIVLNPETVSNFINTNYLSNNKIRDYLFLNFSFDRFISYVTQIFWAYLFLGYAVYFTFKFSGYTLSLEKARISSILFYSVFQIIEPLTSNLRLGINFAHVFVAGFLIVTLILRNQQEKIEN